MLHTGEEVGVLDSRMAATLRKLKLAVPSITLELSVYCEEDQEIYRRQGRKPVSDLPVNIMVYGDNQACEQTGLTLSHAGMYLQEPIDHVHGMQYRNPHFLSLDASLETPLLACASHTPEDQFAAKIGTIFETTASSIPLPPVEPDARISTMLRQ